MMFDAFKDKMQSLKMMQRLMKDENFRKFVTHPKVMSVFQDPEVLELIKSQDSAKMATHPKLAELMQDPELAPLLLKLKPSDLFGEDVHGSS
jgi:hypothetical protein